MLCFTDSTKPGPSPSRARRTWVILPLGLALAALALTVLWRIGSCHRDMDVRSGRIRTRRTFLCGLATSERIEDTTFSELVSEMDLGRSPPVWRPISTMTRHVLAVERIEYRTGPLATACDSLAKAVKMSDLPAQQRKEAVATLLALLERASKNGDYDPVWAYVEGACDKLLSRPAPISRSPSRLLATSPPAPSP